MKLVLAIVNHDDSGAVSNGLNQAGYSATKLATTGGFLRMGNTTFLVGVEEDAVKDVIGIIKFHSSSRTRKKVDVHSYGMTDYIPPDEVTIGGATVFVLDVEQFEKL